MKYFSNKETWVEPSTAISALDGRQIQIHYSNDVDCLVTLYVDSARPEERDAGKCAVSFHFSFPPFPVGDEAADNKTPVVVSHPYIEYLTQDGLEIILNFFRTHLEGAVLELPPDWEYSDR
jgi:hypothetical protein